ncbi:Serine protease gd [Pseudolycoriella hygida]|uniref:Serine protease gd n=1 Tax=Pseudolycoriella hygida TaxID=35572 RepID=A0A9Q0MXY9_9DIPT|nr:Serine protease gd [Pseudolycoriella hygida]
MKLIGLAFVFLFGSLSAQMLNSIRRRSCGIRIGLDIRKNVDEESMDGEYWPWIAAIYQSGSDGLTFKCTGTLIKPNLVLTSAHCMSEIQSQIAASTIEVHFGKSNLKETELSNNQRFSADEIIVHPDFNASNFANNLAIIRLSTDATLNNFVQPVCLTNSTLTETPLTKDELGTVVGWGIKQVTTHSIPNIVQKAFMAVVPNVNCLHNRLSLPYGSFCAFYKSDEKSGTAVSSASLIFTENSVYTVRGIMSEVVLEEGRNNGYVVFTEVAKFISWIEEIDSGVKPTTTTPKNHVCRPNEEFVYDPYRCDETCEGYGNPLCVEYAPEAKCYCKKGFVRLKTVGICVQADNRACRAKMPPTEETCARKENEQLSEWLYDEACPNTCANYNVPCNVTVPNGMFWGPHCE